MTKGVSVLDTPGGKQQVTIINESGLYSLILSSKLPTAKKFKKWVTSEVLPSIRKSGGYIATKQDDYEIVLENKKIKQIVEKKEKEREDSIEKAEEELQQRRYEESEKRILFEGCKRKAFLSLKG